MRVTSQCYNLFLSIFHYFRLRHVSVERGSGTFTQFGQKSIETYLKTKISELHWFLENTFSFDRNISDLCRDKMIEYKFLFLYTEQICWAQTNFQDYLS
jgi:hypothetical protein